MTQLDPLLPEAQVDPDSRPAVDWPTDPWDATDQTGSVERLRGDRRVVKWVVWASMAVAVVAILIAGAVGWWYLGKINPEGAPATSRASPSTNRTTSSRWRSGLPTTA